MHVTAVLPQWVAPFGNLRIDAYLPLPEAYRSLSRPSSAPDAKAFPLCSFSLNLVGACSVSFAPPRLLFLADSRLLGFGDGGSRSAPSGSLNYAGSFRIFLRNCFTLRRRKLRIVRSAVSGSASSLRCASFSSRIFIRSEEPGETALAALAFHNCF